MEEIEIKMSSKPSRQEEVLAHANAAEATHYILLSAELMKLQRRQEEIEATIDEMQEGVDTYNEWQDAYGELLEVEKKIYETKLEMIQFEIKAQQEAQREFEILSKEIEKKSAKHLRLTV